MICNGRIHAGDTAVPAASAVAISGSKFAAIGMTGTTYMKSWQDFDYVILASTPLYQGWCCCGT